MRAVYSDRLGPTETYQLGERPLPWPGPDEVRIRVRAAALGYADGLLAQGRYQVKPPVPFVPACEFAGEIDAVGSAVTTLQCGQRVCAQTLGGGLAEHAVAPISQVVPTPEPLSDIEAAAFWADYLTAFHALSDRGRLQPFETVLVLGAADGVGLAAVQIARLLGGHVIAAASTEAKRAAATAAGAHEVIDYTAADWTDRLKQLTDARGVDVIFDPVGGATFEAAFRRLAWGGRHLVLGFTGGPIPALPANLPLLKGASLVGVDVRQFAMVHDIAKAKAARGALAEHVRAGVLRPQVGAVYTINQFAQALAACQDRNRIGKTVVTL